MKMVSTPVTLSYIFNFIGEIGYNCKHSVNVITKSIVSKTILTCKVLKHFIVCK